MAWRACTALVLLASLAVPAFAQGAVGDFLTGKLVAPEVGQWAWYDLTDEETGAKFVVRQAIVGKEKVGRKTGYWVETEIMPTLGFPSMFKMLLTGPASDPANIHKMVRQQGTEPPELVPVPKPDDPGKAKPKPKRMTVGEEEVETLSGQISCEHAVIITGDRSVDVWTNKKVLPTGIVRMKSPEGELILRNHGTGGENAQSKIKMAPGAPRDEEEESAAADKAE